MYTEPLPKLIPLKTLKKAYAEVWCATHISDNKTRRITGEILEGFGKRVNRSVFEVQVKHNKQRQKLEASLAQELDPKVDSLRIYTICATCMQSATVLHQAPLQRKEPKNA